MFLTIPLLIRHWSYVQLLTMKVLRNYTCHTTFSREGKQDHLHLPKRPLNQLQSNQDKMPSIHVYASPRSYHPLSIADVWMGLSSSSGKPDFVFWNNPWSHSLELPHSMGRNIYTTITLQVTNSHETDSWLLDAWVYKHEWIFIPQEHVQTFVINFTWASLLLLQTMPGMCLPNRRV